MLWLLYKTFLNPFRAGFSRNFRFKGEKIIPGMKGDLWELVKAKTGPKKRTNNSDAIETQFLKGLMAWPQPDVIVVFEKRKSKLLSSIG